MRVTVRTQPAKVYITVKQAMYHKPWHGILSKAVISLHESTCPHSDGIKTVLKGMGVHKLVFYNPCNCHALSH